MYGQNGPIVAICISANFPVGCTELTLVSLKSGRGKNERVGAKQSRCRYPHSLSISKHHEAHAAGVSSCHCTIPKPAPLKTHHRRINHNRGENGLKKKKRRKRDRSKGGEINHHHFSSMAAASETESPSPEISIPEEWSNAADLIARGPVSFPITFVCGPKNSGKTTFARHFVNVLLQRHKRVAFLDTDVGQTEFTPPGLLSLTVIDKITPDLMIPCVKTPARCFFFGDISSKRDPTTYLTYIKALYDQYMETDIQCAGLPLVINTPGWVKGIGYEILVDMLRYMSVTHVVKLQRPVYTKNLPDGAFWLNEGDPVSVTTVIEINAARQNHLSTSGPMRKDARLLRDLRVMAYFRQCFPSDMIISTIKELAHALAAHPPYEIPISSIKIKHLHCQVVTTETFYSLNATIVGLAVSSVSEQLPQCVGLGIVRGIDTFKRLLYVITPVPPQILEDVDLLLQGFVQIPTSLLQVQGCISPYLSTNVLSHN